MTLAPTGLNAFRLTVTAARGWHSDPARRYPVTIDPTLQRRTRPHGTTAFLDCGIQNGAYATTSFCDTDALATGGGPVSERTLVA